MPWRGPAFDGEFPSLGWLVLGWFHEFLPSPADETKPFVVTDEQAKLLIRWFGLDPDTGEFVYRRGSLEMAKGWGKSPLIGAVAIAEMAGPVLFAGWDASGDPVGRSWGTQGSPPPWVQIAAVSEDQTDNTYVALYEMLTANDAKAAKALRIDEGRTRLYLRGRRGRLEPVTASAGSREGQRVTFAVLDETHLWTSSNGGRNLAATLRRNVAKMDGRTFETTNAPALGLESVAEQTSSDAYTKQLGILHYAKRPDARPDPAWSDEQMLDALGSVYGDAWWIDLERILQEIHDPQTSWDDALRYYFNVQSEASEVWIQPALWEACRAEKAVDGSVVLAFTGTYSNDSAAIVGVLDSGHVFVVDAWESAGKLGVDRAPVAAKLKEAVAWLRPRRIVCNPHGWISEVQEWGETYGSALVSFDWAHQAKRKADACSRFYSAVLDRKLTHDGDVRLSRHLSAAVVKETPEGAYITKGGRESPRKVELAVAAVMAFDQVKPEALPMIAWDD